jgi:hypothetical protein
MRKTVLLSAFFLLAAFAAGAQSLDFLGLKDVHFGMKASEMKDKTVILDSTSSYHDTAVYLRNTRCPMYFRKQENLALAGFTASRIEYEFCDNLLTYVFVYVNGKTEIDNAVATLKKTFRKLGCKGKPAGECTQMDASASGMRIIVNIDQKNQRMSFVLIAKKSAGR